MNAPAVALKPSIEEARTQSLGRLWVERQDRRAQLPLLGVRIQARVADRVADVRVEERFQNPFTEALEAVYIFPLSGGAAIRSFELKVGSRTVKGLVREREEARAEYQQALRSGKRAALLEQERDDVFTVRVGNLPPGEEVTVQIEYSERLSFFESGASEIRLPLVVAPRYIPGQPLPRDPVGDGVEWDTDQVPDASRLTPPRLAPGFDPKVALQIEVELAQGSPVELACSQHAIRLGDGRIALARQDELLDRDFILRWRLAQEKVATSLRRTPDGFAMLSILPPRRDGFLGLSRDVVFILDRSGSMSGIKMTSAARACALLLETLGPRDRFSIVAFDDRTEWFSDGKFHPADEANRRAGEKFLRGIESRGGTELDPAFRESLKLIENRAQSEGRVPVLVLLTDGEIGNEAAIFKRLKNEGGDTRVFTVGIDTAVNEAFLKRLSALGGGTCTCVVPGESLEEALLGIGREIGAPLVINLRLEGAEDLAPERVPDLFSGRACTVFFRMDPGSTVTLKGSFADGTPFEETLSSAPLELAAISHLWARARVTDLEDRFRLQPAFQSVIKKEIVDLAVRHTLLTRFTAFVAVDEAEIAHPTKDLRTVVQPVHVPAQWEAEASHRGSGAAAAPRGAVAWGSTLGGGLPTEWLDATRRSTRGLSRSLPPPPPASAPARPLKKSLGIFGSESAPEPEGKVSAADEKAFGKALQELKDALAGARTELGAGRVPSGKSIEKARAALIRILAGSPLGSRMGPLQGLLRSGLLELVAALGDPGAKAGLILPILDRCQAGLEAAFRTVAAKDRFWEQTV
jgi:Ca-activated chloride channel family protein